MMRGSFPSHSMRDASTADVFSQPCLHHLRHSKYGDAQCARTLSFNGDRSCIVNLSKFTSLNGRKRTWNARKRDRTLWFSRPSWVHGKVRWLPYCGKRWQTQSTLYHAADQQSDSLASSLTPTDNGVRSTQKYGEGAKPEILVLTMSKSVHFHLIVKSLIHLVRCFRFREELSFIPSSGLVLYKDRSLITGFASDCSASVAGTFPLICRVLGQALLSALFFVGFCLPPCTRFSASAYAAPPVDVGTVSQSSKDIYDTVQERLKLENRDDELGREQNEGSFTKALEEKLRALQNRIKEQKNRYEAAKRNYEDLRRSWNSTDGRSGWLGKDKMSSSTYEEKVFAIMEKNLQALQQRINEDVKTYDDETQRLETAQGEWHINLGGKGTEETSVYEEKLRRTFEERFQALQALEKEAGRRAGKEAALLMKVREVLDSMMVERRRLQGISLRDMETTLSHLKQDKARLTGQLRKAIEKHLAAEERLQKFDGKGKGKDREQDGRFMIERELQKAEIEFVETWEKLIKAEANILQKEVQGFQVAFEKLPRLEQQYKEAISRFLKERSSASSSTEIQEKVRQEKISEDLKQTFDKIWEHRFLPQTVDIEESELPMDEQTRELLEILRLEEENSKQIIETVDKMIKEDLEAEQMMSENDGVNGSPSDRSQRQLEKEEEQVRKIGSLNIAPSLKKWREEKTAEFQQYLLDNVEVASQYVAEKQEQILLARDRVMARTWYDEKHKRWEMSHEVVEYAVTKELVESARIRHDRGVMYLNLKGDDRVYYVNLKAFDAYSEEHGGFDTLHEKMIISGVPTSVEVMWIPFSEWEPARLFLLPFKMCYAALRGVWQSGSVTPILNMYLQSLIGTVEELLARICFPLLEKLPKQAQIAIGLQLADNAATSGVTTFLMELKKRAQKSMEVRYEDNEGSTAWWISLPVRCFIVGLPLVYFSRQARKALRLVLGPGEELNEVEWKEKKGKELMKKLDAEDTKDVVDPVRQAFDRMKRIKQPDISLKDFGGLDAVKDEINEIVTFLRNPLVFKEMGARPPRGVLIVGQPGTGKTTLAMAIAAEAKVPMVELQGLELEGGAWVGQGASNVRELFKTARELAPLIIFMDDFDYFAGVRGDSGDTRKQDHESLINQLLVELDGFETQEGVVLMATSSRPGNIDEALRRPGRMDRTIELSMPNKREREIILRAAAEATMDLNLIDLVDWKEMARKTEGMTPQQLKVVPQGLEASFVTWKHTDDEELFSIFGWLATLNSITPEWLARSKWMRNWKSGMVDWLGLRVTKADIDAAVESVDVFCESQPGLEMRNPGYNWTRDFKFPHAVWAAGRGLVGLLLPNFDLVEQIWLDPTSWEGIGFTRFTKRMEGGYEETGTITRSYYEKKLVLCFGSSVASRLLLPYGENNNLSKYEIREAQEIATSMVLEYGWGPDDSQAIYMSGLQDVTMGMGEDLEYELNAKIEKLFHTAFTKAAEMLQKNRRVLDAFVEHLLQFDALSRKDMLRILEENGATLEEDPFMLVTYANDGEVQVSTNGTGRTTTRLLSATAMS